MDQVLIDQIPHYHYRKNTDDDIKTAFEKISSVGIKPVKEMVPIYLCVVATETSSKGKQHIHAQIITNIDFDTLRARLLKVYPGRGNKSYSLEHQRNDNNLSYVIKGGVYMYSPEMEQSIRTAPQWTEKPSSFDMSYSILKERYNELNMSDYDFIYEMLTLYSDFHKAIYISHLRAIWLGVANQRNLAFNDHGLHRINGNGRPIRNRLCEEIMRGFFIADN